MKSSIRNILSKAPFRGLGVVSLLLLLHVLPAVAERPKLVVGIMVDGLRQEHLDAFHDYFVEGGLKTLMHGGTALPHMRYPTASAGNAPDVATVMTGATPAYHGVAGNVYFNRHKGHEESVLLDADQVGIGTQHKQGAHTFYGLNTSLHARTRRNKLLATRAPLCTARALPPLPDAGRDSHALQKAFKPTTATAVSAHKFFSARPSMFFPSLPARNSRVFRKFAE